MSYDPRVRESRGFGSSEFKPTPLRQRVSGLRHSPGMSAKSARVGADAPASPAPETRLLATRNVQLMTENEVLHYRPCTESAGRDRDDGTNELKHASDTTAAHSENLDFWER